MEMRRLLVVWSDTGDSASVTAEARSSYGTLIAMTVTDAPLDDPLVLRAIATWQELSGRLFDR